MKTTITFLFNSIGPKHRMPFRQLGSAFLHQELEELVSFGDIKVIRALGLLYPPLVHSQRLLALHNFSSVHFLVIIKFLNLISLLEELVIDISYVMVLGKYGILLESHKLDCSSMTASGTTDQGCQIPYQTASSE
jgi:hypothetical protein